MKNNSSSRIIPAEELGGASVWKVGALPTNRAHATAAVPPSALGANGRGKRRVPGSEEAAAAALTERRVKEAYANGYATGYAEAESKVRAQFSARQSQIAPIVHAAQQAAETLDERVSGHVLALAIAIARQVVRAELALDPQVFLGLVREGLGLISDNVPRIAIHVNPADAPLVREDLEGYDPRVSVIEDATVTAGGCMFHTAHGEIDASIERRMQAVTSPLGMPPEVADAPARRAHAQDSLSSAS